MKLSMIYKIYKSEVCYQTYNIYQIYKSKAYL